MGKINYWEPIQEAWEKMVEVLFRPFEIGKWMVIGFGAFLANLGRESGSGGSSGSSNYGSSSENAGESLADTCAKGLNYVSDIWAEHATLIITLSGVAILLLIAISFFVNWLNGRGQFILLDNVLNNRGAVAEPWGGYRKEGNSLMIFQVVLEWVASVIIIALIAGGVICLLPVIIAEEFSGIHLGAISAMVVLFVLICIVVGFVKMVLNHFVVPLMYHHRISVLDGFKAFAPIFKNNFWRIVLFGLVMFLVSSVVGIAVLFGIVLTCCTALLVLIIPYIGTVALLPVFVFQRFIGLEFMKQFGDEYDLVKDFKFAAKVIPAPPEDPDITSETLG